VPVLPLPAFSLAFSTGEPRKVTVPRLSIIIPLRGAAEPFEATLASVLQNRPNACEVLVPHAGPYPDPYDLADEVRFIEQPADATVVDLLNAGAAESAAEILHVLASGVEVVDGWTAAAVAHFDDPDVAAVSPLILHAADKKRIVAKGVNYGSGGRRRICGAKAILRERSTRRVRVAGPTLAAGFYRAETLDALGGFDRSVGDELTDVDLALAVQTLGQRCVFEPQCRLLSPPITVPSGSFSAGRQAERLFLRHAPQRGWLWSLLLHPFVVAAGAIGDLPHPGAVTQLLGRAVAYFELSRRRADRERLTEARERIAGLHDRNAESQANDSPIVRRVDTSSALQRIAMPPATEQKRRAA
jgi:hypothetical protein